MKSPAKWLAVLLGGVTLMTTACASRDYETRNVPPNHFYCENCDEYHTFQHAHYRYYSGEYPTYPARPAKISVITQPDRSTPLGAPQPFMVPPNSRVD